MPVASLIWIQALESLTRYEMPHLFATIIRVPEG